MDESFQDQNTAHNLAHEHITGEIEAWSSTFMPAFFKPTAQSVMARGDDLDMTETSPIYLLVLDKWLKLVKNVTKLESKFVKTSEKLESMEDTNLSRAELRD